MNDIADIAAMERRLVDWRHDLHIYPETAFEEHRTAAFVARELRAAGLEVHEGIGPTGVVGILHNGDESSIGLRANMDALDIEETNSLRVEDSLR